MKIEITDDTVNTQTGKSRDGKDYMIRSQHGYIDLGKTYPVEITISLESEQRPYPKGVYALDMASSLYVGKYGRLTLGRLNLVQVQK